MPPAKWRDWYPHKIDKWRGSLAVQGMSDGAYRGYHNLIMSQWQSFDGMLPKTDKELARLSGLFGRWKEFREEILENFQNLNERIFNSDLKADWDHAQWMTFWRPLRRKILYRDARICQYCGGAAVEVDHIIPRSKGGTNEESNLVACCLLCNRSKGDKTVEEWCA
jgi:hypothetical protein